MAVILRELIRSYRLCVNELSDQRTIDWPLMRSPLPVIGILCVYLWLVLKAGPAFMKSRKPYQLDTLIQIYNLVQVAVCGYLAYHGFTELYGPWGRFSFLCEPIDYGVTEFNWFLLKLSYTYFSLKILDLFDTIFFILRKKDQQVSFLHVYHHTLMVLMSWVGMRFTPGGHVSYIGIINSFVHAVMYGYYFLTNYDKNYRKNVWWKKYLTQLQLFQFGSILVHACLPFFFDCGMPRTLIALLIPQNFFIFVLFLDFYKKAYLKPQPVKQN